jgi:hypothetical protein
MPATQRLDADFAADVLADLYAYGTKRRWLARLLWGTLGWFGAHRFYLGRPLTGLLMLFTLGGGLVWWVVDAFLLTGMVRSRNDEQARRARLGMPPIELDFMPALRREVLSQPPEWTERWRAAGRGARVRRFAGDLLVLVVVGAGLGSVARAADVWEAVVAVAVLSGLASAGASVGRFGHLPVVRGLVRWSHRMRLFYYYTTPGSPAALLFRPVTGAFLAPFRRRARAEANLYLQLGAVFTLAFLLLDFGGEVIVPAVTGQGFPGLAGIAGLWLREATLTFLVIYAFATPIGAVLTLYLLMLPTHTVPRMLGGIVMASVFAGLLL